MSTLSVAIDQTAMRACFESIEDYTDHSVNFQRYHIVDTCVLLLHVHFIAAKDAKPFDQTCQIGSKNATVLDTNYVLRTKHSHTFLYPTTNMYADDLLAKLCARLFL